MTYVQLVDVLCRVLTPPPQWEPQHVDGGFSGERGASAVETVFHDVIGVTTL